MLACLRLCVTSQLSRATLKWLKAPLPDQPAWSTCTLSFNPTNCSCCSVCTLLVGTVSDRNWDRYGIKKGLRLACQTSPSSEQTFWCLSFFGSERYCECDSSLKSLSLRTHFHKCYNKRERERERERERKRDLTSLRFLPPSSISRTTLGPAKQLWRLSGLSFSHVQSSSVGC